MSHIDQLRQSIEARLAELKEEITALEAARSALQGDRPARAKPAAARPTNGRARAERSAAPAPTAAAGRRTKARKARTTKSGRSIEVLLADRLETMLKDADGGLSAITIAKRSNAGYNQVLGLLRDLERTGRVRRSGTRRTSLWRLITDEERIAERTAELEAIAAAASSS
jgi:hypothetical protein